MRKIKIEHSIVPGVSACLGIVFNWERLLENIEFEECKVDYEETDWICPSHQLIKIKQFVIRDDHYVCVGLSVPDYEFPLSNRVLELLRWKSIKVLNEML